MEFTKVELAVLRGIVNTELRHTIALMMDEMEHDENGNATKATIDRVDILVDLINKL